jgi:hypothetical protein
MKHPTSDRDHHLPARRDLFSTTHWTLPAESASAIAARQAFDEERREEARRKGLEHATNDD